MEDVNEDNYPHFDPEDCDSCGLDASDFSSEDWDNGHYKCPACGAVC